MSTTKIMGENEDKTCGQVVIKNFLCYVETLNTIGTRIESILRLKCTDRYEALYVYPNAFVKGQVFYELCSGGVECGVQCKQGGLYGSGYWEWVVG